MCGAFGQVSRSKPFTKERQDYPVTLTSISRFTKLNFVSWGIEVAWKIFAPDADYDEDCDYDQQEMNISIIWDGSGPVIENALFILNTSIAQCIYYLDI